MQRYFLLPSYILVSYKNQEIQAQIDNLKATAEKKNRPELTRRLADINSKINSVVIPESEYAHYDLIEKILSLKPAGVAIDSLAMNHVISKDKTDVLKVRMSGVSDTRNNLVTFNDALKADDTYVDVYLPIESLAQEFETDFVINFDINL